VIAVDCTNVVEAEQRLRAGDPPVVARVADGRLIFDLRTVFSAEEEALLSALQGLALQP
jgi:seryl-tRNA(Sec) selenium transferase